MSICKYKVIVKQAFICYLCLLIYKNYGINNTRVHAVSAVQKYGVLIDVSTRNLFFL